jgi:hypothetical protein
MPGNLAKISAVSEIGELRIAKKIDEFYIFILSFFLVV